MSFEIIICLAFLSSMTKVEQKIKYIQREKNFFGKIKIIFHHF